MVKNGGGLPKKVLKEREIGDIQRGRGWPKMGVTCNKGNSRMQEEIMQRKIRGAVYF